MTLNGLMAVALHYFTEFGKPVFQHVSASICGGIYARVYCILHCMYDVVFGKFFGKFTFAISSPDKFFVVYGYINAYIIGILCFNIVASETSKKR